MGAIKDALENTPPELSADLVDMGLVLTGGGAMLKDVDRLLMEECGVPVIIAEDPLTCVARGGGKYLEMIDEFGIDNLLKSGENVAISFTPEKPGSYEFYCNVAGHLEAGMKCTLTVTE